MPSALSDKFLRYCQRTAKTQHNSIKAGGCYCLASPESGYWRPRFGHRKSTVKVGKSWDICKRMNEYMLNYPFNDPGLDLQFMLLMPHPESNQQRANIDNAEKFILSTLRARYSRHWHWPGLLERNRLYPPRSEWGRGVPREEIAHVFRQAAKRFQPALFVYDDDNVPERWYRFKQGLAQKRKRVEYNTKAPPTPAFRTTAEDRKRKR